MIELVKLEFEWKSSEPEYRMCASHMIQVYVVIMPISCLDVMSKQNIKRVKKKPRRLIDVLLW